MALHWATVFGKALQMVLASSSCKKSSSVDSAAQRAAKGEDRAREEREERMREKIGTGNKKGG